MDRHSQNYLRVYCFYFPHACSVLRNLFQKRWKSLTTKDWENTSSFQKNLVTNCIDEFYKKALYLKKSNFQRDRIDEWNLKSFTRILQNFNFNNQLSADLQRRENNMITTLITLSIQVSCNPRLTLPDNEFLEILKNLEDILTHFGSSPITLRKLKSSDLYSMLKEVDLDEKLTASKTPAKINDIKRTANKYYMDGEYKNAVKYYCQALNIQNLSTVDRAVLYSNRSAAVLAAASASPNTKAINLSIDIYGTMFPDLSIDQLELELVILYQVKKAAKDDAKKSVQLRPSWFRGHYRLACAYQSLSKYQDALRHFDIAIKLNPTIQEMNDAKDMCSKMLLKDGRPTQFMSCIQKFMKLIKECEIKKVKSNTFWEMWTSSYPFDVQVINRCSAKGSLTANKLKTACIHYAKALIFLNSEGEAANANFVQELSNCLQIEPVTAYFSETDKKLAMDIVTKMLRSQEIHTLSELDKNIRICFAYLMLPESVNFEFLDESAAKYPKEEYFQELYCIQFACFEANDEDALEQLELALKTFPNNCKLQYTKADVLRRMYDCPGKSIESFQHYLDLVAEDDRLVPNVCYKIAFLNACQMFMFGNRKLFAEVKKYFIMGEKAEKIQLPFFQLQKTEFKSALQIIIQTLYQHM
uniref:Uncharacterized protein n=1 Tax=Strigamia maritima TaxID=126957 RepID=T1J9N2_STRMM